MRLDLPYQHLTFQDTDTGRLLVAKTSARMIAQGKAGEILESLTNQDAAQLAAFLLAWCWGNATEESNKLARFCIGALLEWRSGMSPADLLPLLQEWGIVHQIHQDNTGGAA